MTPAICSALRTELAASTMATNWTVYVLISATGKRTYVGITIDPTRRTAQHNGELSGGAKATRAGRPWTIGAVYGPYPNRSEALRAEYAVKRCRGRQRLTWKPPASDDTR